MAQIEIILEKQLLTIQNREVISSGDMNYDSCKFEFDEAWADYIKTAVFYQNRQQIYYAVLDKENKCIIPAMALAKASPLYIGVFGVLGNKIITSTIDSISIVEGAVSGTELDIEPSDTVFASLVAHYQAILDAIAMQNTILDQEKAELAKQLDIAKNETVRKMEEVYEETNDKLTGAQKLLESQNEMLEHLGAFELEPLENRMSAMEITLAGYGNEIREEHSQLNRKLQEIEDSAFVIPDVTVTFNAQNEFLYADERITNRCLVNAYFDPISVVSAIGHAIFVESLNGQIRFTTTTVFNKSLNCTIEVRRY